MVDGKNNPTDMVTKSRGRVDLDRMLKHKGLRGVEGRAQPTPELVEDEKGSANDFDVERNVGCIMGMLDRMGSSGDGGFEGR